MLFFVAWVGGTQVVLLEIDPFGIWEPDIVPCFASATRGFSELSGARSCLKIKLSNSLNPTEQNRTRFYCLRY